MALSLAGRRILIVEDEYYLAAELAEALREHGADVIGPVGTYEAAVKAVQVADFDTVVLDMNLRGEMSHSLADRLDAMDIPYLITTGYSAESLPERLRDKPRIEKPFRPERVMELLAREHRPAD